MLLLYHDIGWALFHVCPWIFHSLCQGERTLGGDSTTPLLADFSSGLVSAKAPRHRWFCINVLLNDSIMDLWVCTFLRQHHSWAVLGKAEVWVWAGLTLTGLCRAGVSWGCCPEGNQGLKTAWWTSAVLGVVNECGNADQISCPATGYSLLCASMCEECETPCSDKPLNSTLWTESVSENHPQPCSNILFVINSGFLGCDGLGKPALCCRGSIGKCLKKHRASFFIKGIASPIRAATIGVGLIFDLNERDFLDPLA